MTECSICLINDIEATDKCITNCSHNFCKSCIDSWFDSGKQSCPLCRQPIQYFSYSDERYRLVFYNHSNELSRQTNIRLQSYSYKLISTIIVLAFLSQLFIIYYLYEKYYYYKNSYLYMIHENNKYINIINANKYMDITDTINITIFNENIQEYFICNIPFYFIQECIS